MLDFAEIPTFQQKDELDPNGDGELSERGGPCLPGRQAAFPRGRPRSEGGKEELPLRVLDSSAAYRPGQGGLPVLRVEASLLADLPKDWERKAQAVTPTATTRDHLGWREIVVQGGPGVAIKDSTAPATGVSDGLRKYPQDMLSSPLDVREARFTLVSRQRVRLPATPPATSARALQLRVERHVGGSIRRLNSLISFDRLLAGGDPLSLLAALLWGAVHAFTPGSRQNGRGGVPDRGPGNGQARRLSSG